MYIAWKRANEQPQVYVYDFKVHVY